MGLLLILTSVGGLFSAAILFAVAVWKKQSWLKRFTLGAAAAWFTLYAALLFGTSLTSEEKTLSANEPKEFCGFYLDCHLHASVSGVRRAKQLAGKIADGEFYVVTVKVFSDARRAELGLVSPEARVVDADGGTYERGREAENALVGTATEPPFDRDVPAGGAFEKQIVFDLPPDVKNPRLDIVEGIGIDKVIEAVLIGDEDSILHRRNYFKLDAYPQAASN